MAQGLNTAGLFVGVVLAQLYLAELLQVGGHRPDFILIFLVYMAVRYGRIWGILLGFGVGLMQDLAGALSVLGANALAKSVVGYTLGTLNGNLAVWTSGVVNLYVYGSLLAHAILYQVVMVQGLQITPGFLAGNVLIEVLFSGILVVGMRYMWPLVPSQA